MTCGAVFQKPRCAEQRMQHAMAFVQRRLNGRDTPQVRSRTRAFPSTRRVSPMARQKKVRSFSPATCAAEKIPLGLQTCAPSAKADGACAAAGRNPFRQNSTTFLTKTTPQAWPAGLPLYDAASAAVSISSLGRRRAAPSSDHSDSSAFFSAESFLIFGMPQMNAGSTTTTSA